MKKTLIIGWFISLKIMWKKVARFFHIQNLGSWENDEQLLMGSVNASKAIERVFLFTCSTYYPSWPWCIYSYHLAHIVNYHWVNPWHTIDTRVLSDKAQILSVEKSGWWLSYLPHTDWWNSRFTSHVYSRHRQYLVLVLRYWGFDQYWYWYWYWGLHFGRYWYWYWYWGSPCQKYWGIEVLVWYWYWVRLDTQCMWQEV